MTPGPGATKFRNRTQGPANVNGIERAASFFAATFPDPAPTIAPGLGPRDPLEELKVSPTTIEKVELQTLADGEQRRVPATVVALDQGPASGVRGARQGPGGWCRCRDELGGWPRRRLVGRASAPRCSTSPSPPPPSPTNRPYPGGNGDVVPTITNPNPDPVTVTARTCPPTRFSPAASPMRTSGPRRPVVPRRRATSSGTSRRRRRVPHPRSRAPSREVPAVTRTTP